MTRTLVPKPPPLLVVISGASGVGKDTVIDRMKELGYPFHFLVTTTSRPKREDELDGVDYNFISPQQFQRMIEKGEFIEHAVVYGQQKGIPKIHARKALRAGQDVVMRVDVQGARTVRRLVPQAVLIFLTTASEDELFRRLQRRGTECADELAVRMDMAREENCRREDFDYLVLNADCRVDDAVADIVAIIRAEKCRVHPRPPVDL